MDLFKFDNKSSYHSYQCAKNSRALVLICCVARQQSSKPGRALQALETTSLVKSRTASMNLQLETTVYCAVSLIALDIYGFYVCHFVCVVMYKNV